MDVSVIIVNYKTSHLISECLKSVYKFTKDLTFEIFLVDNNSEPDFEKTIRKEFPERQIEIILLPDNIGFGCANNVAYEKATGRNILFLNPDTLLLNNAIKILSDFLDRHPHAGACGGNLLGEDLKPTLSFKRSLPGIEWELDELLHNGMHKIKYGKNRIYNNSDNPFEVGYITGADLMVKRSVLKQTGVFNPAFFMYYEESDLCARIKRAGWQIFSVPEARIQHLVGKSFGEVQLNPRKIEMLEKSRNTYYKLNHNKFKRTISHSLYDLFLISRKTFSKDPIKKERYRLRRKYFLTSK